MNIGEEDEEPIEVPMPVHPDQIPAGPVTEPVTEPAVPGQVPA